MSLNPPEFEQCDTAVAPPCSQLILGDCTMIVLIVHGIGNHHSEKIMEEAERGFKAHICVDI
jgi:hypothetical protein